MPFNVVKATYVVRELYDIKDFRDKKLQDAINSLSILSGSFGSGRTTGDSVPFCGGTNVWHPETSRSV